MGFSSSLIHPYEATKTETNHEAQTNTTTNQNTKEGFIFTFRFDFIWAGERDFICFFIIEEIDTESHREIHRGVLEERERDEERSSSSDCIEERSSSRSYHQERSQSHQGER
ncbi:hypothetical protein F2Q70_00040287 [Brassica cretica]|uniref:Uncharacterized protein n=1 Tax=Brassica cretica TaxID=69181 RepID=A0A8S9MNT7_BRACR|nr:hypothetical protein F2Q70_00040287 [Brassica cretica]KAF2620742.1 hypothetical protein F2Q68_00040972 [Brassica cretica]